MGGNLLCFADLLFNSLFLCLSIAGLELFLQVVNGGSISSDVIKYRYMSITTTHKILVCQVKGHVSYFP